MLPYNFDYYKPRTINEAIDLYQVLKSQERKPLYYGGGTEVLTLGRLNYVYTDAIIDLKGIPECNVFEFQHQDLIIGSTLSLRVIVENKLFPLLSSYFSSHNKKLQTNDFMTVNSK
ncbi:FAD binding domain-containing protein [Peribacillus sp. NPDC060253]|uniref:FAD binding domain-containing protein n=1 Tax=Peribacillus sp. NPDC060253 TaxID=3347084 RepID=UPI00364B0C65